jgi:hypothetical protein
MMVVMTVVPALTMRVAAGVVAVLVVGVSHAGRESILSRPRDQEGWRRGASQLTLALF